MWSTLHHRLRFHFLQLEQIFPPQQACTAALLTLPKGVCTADHRTIIISALYSEAPAPYRSNECEERQEERGEERGEYASVRSIETKVVVARFEKKKKRERETKEPKRHGEKTAGRKANAERQKQRKTEEQPDRQRELIHSNADYSRQNLSGLPSPSRAHQAITVLVATARVTSCIHSIM